MALTFTLTSFTCTVQFLGLVLVSAANGEWFWPMIGMFVFSLAFAAPFFILAFFAQTFIIVALKDMDMIQKLLKVQTTTSPDKFKQLKARAIIGAANNVLSCPTVAKQLQQNIQNLNLQAFAMK